MLPLDALLDYSENDVKECHFEVSMFGELLKEMLQTRFARGLVRGMAIIEQEVSPSWLFTFALLLTFIRKTFLFDVFEITPAFLNYLL